MILLSHRKYQNYENQIVDDKNIEKRS